MNDPSLAGARILVVEDEAMVSMLVEDILADAGCTVVGPAASVADALRLLRCPNTARPDAAILDMNLGGDTSEPVADDLDALGIPFVLATGYGRNGVGSRFRNATILGKPFEMADLLRTVGALLQR